MRVERKITIEVNHKELENIRDTLLLVSDVFQKLKYEDILENSEGDTMAEEEVGTLKVLLTKFYDITMEEGHWTNGEI